MERFIVFGASNAAGWSEIHMVGYHPSNLLRLLYIKSDFLKIGADSATLDLSKKPELEEGTPVLNEGFPGDTVYDLADRIQSDVIDNKPTSVFLWPGLNDITYAVGLMHGQEAQDDAFTKEIVIAIQKRKNSIDSLAGTIYAQIWGMNDLILKEKCKVYLGTIPPFSSALSRHLSDPLGKAYFNEGSVLIKKVNEKIRGTKGASIVDAYTALVDLESGLMKPEFSYGAPKERSGDILHLNDNGQLAVAGVLFQAILGKPVRIIACPPGLAQI